MKTFKSFKANLEEKKLTPAEMKKREEVAKAIERENPNMPMGMKMAIATKTAKRVAEEEQIDELKTSTLLRYSTKANKALIGGDRNKEEKRIKGIQKAVHKIKSRYSNVKEESELDELNQMTLARYQSKAKSVGMQGGPKSAKHLAGAKRAGEKLKYGDYSEEVEQVDEVSKKTAVSYIQKKVSQIAKRPGEAMLYTTKMTGSDYENLKRAYKRAGVKEEVKDEYARKVDKYLKKKYNKEEFELDEATQFPSKEHAISYAKEKVKTHKDSDDGIEVYSMPGGGARVVHTMNSQGRQQVLKGGGKKVTTVTREHVELDEAGPFSYGAKPPKKGSVAYNAMMKRKEQDNKPPIEPKDQMVGTAKLRKEETELDETKSAPKGFHFTKDGKLKRGDADQDGPGGPMLRSDPLDKQRSKVPPVSEAPEDRHYCAKHVYSNVYGEGVVLEGQHADPDENGNIEWYVVEFAEGPKKVYTEKLDIMVAEYHGNHKRKKRMTNG